MSFDAKIDALIAAINANTEALKGAGGAKSAAAPAPAAKAKTEAAAAPAAVKPKHTRAEMQAALNEVKEKFSPADAKGIIKDSGKVDKMSDIPDAAIDAVYDACKAKMGEGEGGGDSGDGL
jgi:hypothetical protein